MGLWAMGIGGAGAQVVEVPEDYATVQGAIDAVTTGGFVIVWPGTYQENLRIVDKEVHLSSVFSGYRYSASSTILDGGGAGPVIEFSGAGCAGSSVSGFTLTNGSGGYGGAIGGEGQDVLVQYNRIVKNESTSFGGAVSGINGVIQFNAIDMNHTKYAGGGLYKCNGSIRNNVISRNAVVNINSSSLALAGGGGLYKCDGVICNNYVLSNYVYAEHTGYQYPGANFSSAAGGGLDECGGTIRNNVIAYNILEAKSPAYLTYKRGTAAAFCPGIIENNTIAGSVELCKGTLRNNIHRNDSFQQILWSMTDCTTPTFSLVELDDLSGTGAGEGCFDADPEWVNPDLLDFRLGNGSPGIDAGDPDEALVDGCFPPGLGEARNDVGAFGGPGNCGWSLVREEDLGSCVLGIGEAAEEKIPGIDPNDDGVVDVSDVVRYRSQYPWVYPLMRPEPETGSGGVR